MRWTAPLIALALLLGACATPTPPKPAMAPLGVNGDFGYSERDLGSDAEGHAKIEVSYRGETVKVDPRNPRDDFRNKVELDKAYDLALWRAAEIASTRHKAGLKVESDTKNSDVEVRHRTYYRPDPFYDPFFDPYDDPFWPPFHRLNGPDFGPMYRFEDIPTATSRAEAKLTVTLYDAFDAKVDGMLATDATLTQMKAKRGGEMY
ncbi:MAG TPA: hypothetical protein VHE77_18405 [Dongiaceae bacterium]|jgi:hypothetical protein|nr:hypothetical protein [Dongiaceae bacterium]